MWPLQSRYLPCRLRSLAASHCRRPPRASASLGMHALPRAERRRGSQPLQSELHHDCLSVRYKWTQQTITGPQACVPVGTYQGSRGSPLAGRLALSCCHSPRIVRLRMGEAPEAHGEVCPGHCAPPQRCIACIERLTQSAAESCTEPERSRSRRPWFRLIPPHCRGDARCTEIRLQRPTWFLSLHSVASL